jgi:hypothetical protein
VPARVSRGVAGWVGQTRACLAAGGLKSRLAWSAAADVDDGNRLTLTFDDGPHLTAAADSWEANWPMAGDTLDEPWVPREGPNIP